VCRVRFLNTVIGKMSQVVADPNEVQARRLYPDHTRLREGVPGRGFQPHPDRAVSGSRNRSCAASVCWQEKGQLARHFREAKLYGHNATHAILVVSGSHAGRTACG